MASSKTNNNPSNKPVKKRLSPEQRSQRLQRILFGAMAVLIIATWIISLVAHI